MYTCVAYLIEIRQFCSKNLVHKGVNFEAQNALKLTTSTFNLKKFRGYTPGPPLKGGEGGEPPQFTFLATPLVESVYTVGLCGHWGNAKLSHRRRRCMYRCGLPTGILSLSSSL